MKRLFVIAAISGLVLAGCASGPAAYGPASKPGAYGYTQQKIQNDRFQVSFTGANPDEARNLALLRAAELTLDNGYSHFRIIGEWMDGQKQTRSPVSTSVGVGVGSGGWGGTRTSVGVGVGLGNVAGALGGKKATARLEIIAQNTGGASGGNVYDALSVTQSIRPASVKP